jgi:hypothetical protein
MALFKIDQDKLSRIKSQPFSLEKEIQSLTEKNLDELFNLKFICSEFSIKKFRIDSLAFDKEVNAFVIIEYKKDKNFSVIDQGYAYLSLMLNNKADFILEYNESLDAKLKKNDVDWSQTKIIFIAPSFTTFQKESINFKDLPIELWEIKRFSGNMVLYNRITSDGAIESIKTISKDKKLSSITEEIKTYSEEKILDGVSKKIQDTYFNLKEEIYQLENEVYMKITKTMICFYSDGKGLVWIQPLKKSIKIHLRKGKYQDKYKKIKTDGWGGYPELILPEDEIDLSYLKQIFQQAFEN